MIVPGVRMKYKNYRGEVSIREVDPSGAPQFMATEYHPEPQWIMRAWDYGKGDFRDFALKDCDFTVDQGDAANDTFWEEYHDPKNGAECETPACESWPHCACGVAGHLPKVECKPSEVK